MIVAVFAKTWSFLRYIFEQLIRTANIIGIFEVSVPRNGCIRFQNADATIVEEDICVPFFFSSLILRVNRRALHHTVYHVRV